MVTAFSLLTFFFQGLGGFGAFHFYYCSLAAFTAFGAFALTMTISMFFLTWRTCFSFGTNVFLVRVVLEADLYGKIENSFQGIKYLLFKLQLTK